MRKLNILINKFLQFRRKHFTYFIIGEQVFLYIVIILMNFLNKVYSYIIDTEEMYEIGKYKFQFFGEIRGQLLVPTFTSLIVLILTFIIFYIKDIKINPIKARKLVAPTFITSIVASVITVFMFIFFGYMVLVNEEESLVYVLEHRLAYTISLVSQLLILLDIYRWKTTFNLEKIYGNNSIYG